MLSKSFSLEFRAVEEGINLLRCIEFWGKWFVQHQWCVFSTNKVLMKETIFTSSTRVGTTISHGHLIETHKGLAFYRAEAEPSFLSYFSPEYWSSPRDMQGIEFTASCIEVKNSPAWATSSPAAVHEHECWGTFWTAQSPQQPLGLAIRAGSQRNLPAISHELTAHFSL